MTLYFLASLRSRAHLRRSLTSCTAAVYSRSTISLIAIAKNLPLTKLLYLLLSYFCGSFETRFFFLASIVSGTSLNVRSSQRALSSRLPHSHISRLTVMSPSHHISPIVIVRRTKATVSYTKVSNDHDCHSPFFAVTTRHCCYY